MEATVTETREELPTESPAVPSEPQRKLTRSSRGHPYYEQAQTLKRIRRTTYITGTYANGRKAKEWRAFAYEQYGGWRVCPVHVKRKIEAATFFLWRALEMQDAIISDYKRRGTILNKRSNRPPAIHAFYDTAMGQFLRINDELQLGDARDINGLFHKNGSTP